MDATRLWSCSKAQVAARRLFAFGQRSRNRRASAGSEASWVVHPTTARGLSLVTPISPSRARARMRGHPPPSSNVSRWAWGPLARDPDLTLPRTRTHARAPTPVEQRLAMGPAAGGAFVSAVVSDESVSPDAPSPRTAHRPKVRRTGGDCPFDGLHARTRGSLAC